MCIIFLKLENNKNIWKMVTIDSLFVLCLFVLKIMLKFETEWSDNVFKVKNKSEIKYYNLHFTNIRNGPVKQFVD